MKDLIVLGASPRGQKGSSSRYVDQCDLHSFWAVNEWNMQKPE